MIIPDVNVLVAAFRSEHEQFAAANEWLGRAAGGAETVGLTEAVSSGYVRIVTHPRIFDEPTPLSVAFDQVTALRKQRAVQVVGPGPRHWEVFRRLCVEGGARGGHVADAHHAAVAVEHGATFITLDRGFGRFPGLRWRSPFDS